MIPSLFRWFRKWRNDRELRKLWDKADSGIDLIRSLKREERKLEREVYLLGEKYQCTVYGGDHAALEARLMNYMAEKQVEGSQRERSRAIRALDVLRGVREGRHITKEEQRILNAIENIKLADEKPPPGLL